jgi:hypothetical protein
MKRALLILVVLAGGCRGAKKQPTPCEELGYDTCRTRKDCVATHIDPGPDTRGPMFSCDPRER